MNDTEASMVEKKITVTNVLGIHARPATLLVQAASRFEADIFLSKGDVSRINGKSIMGVMMLAAEKGTQLLLEAEGSDAEAALEALGELLASDFEGRI
ncbi:MAG: HPr family phosphocarrier protein [Candidatus Latescibacterota bacterium]